MSLCQYIFPDFNFDLDTYISSYHNICSDIDTFIEILHWFLSDFHVYTSYSFIYQLSIS